MEHKETNLIEFLKDKTEEYPLYSPMYGELWLAEVSEEYGIITCYKDKLLAGDTRAILDQEDTVSFYSNGTTGDENFNVTKERMLFTMDEWNDIKKVALIDLYARVPYHTMVNFNDNEGCDYELTLKTLCDFPEKSLKVYLRPMSSMTEEEKLEYLAVTKLQYNDNKEPYRELTIEAIDWLNTHHFDYRGLIEKGLALEAPEGMYN